MDATVRRRWTTFATSFVSHITPMPYVRVRRGCFVVCACVLCTHRVRVLVVWRQHGDEVFHCDRTSLKMLGDVLKRTPLAQMVRDGLHVYVIDAMVYAWTAVLVCLGSICGAFIAQPVLAVVTVMFRRPTSPSPSIGLRFRLAMCTAPAILVLLCAGPEVVRLSVLQGLVA